MSTDQHHEHRPAVRGGITRPAVRYYRAARDAGALRPLLILFFATILFDFRRAEGDTSPFVVIMGLANLVCGAAYVVARRQTGTAAALFWLLPFFLLAWLGTVTGLINDQDVYAVVSKSFPILIFCCAVLAVTAAETPADKAFLLKLIVATSFLASIIKVFIALFYLDLALDTVRFQIVSGALPLLFAYGVCGLVVEFKRLALPALVVTLSVVIASVTRTYVLAFLITFGVAIFSQGRLISRRGNIALVMLAFVAPIALLILLTLEPTIIDRWVGRFSVMQEKGFDLTGAARLAEIDYQLRRLGGDVWGLLFGFGHAARNGLAGEYGNFTQDVLGRESVIDFQDRGYGHNFYVGLVYVGGLVCAVPIIAALLTRIGKGISFARRFGSDLSALDRFLLVWGLSGMAGYLACGLLAGTFGDRSQSFFFGVSVGLVFIGSRASMIRRPLPPRRTVRRHG